MRLLTFSKRNGAIFQYQRKTRPRMEKKGGTFVSNRKKGEKKRKELYPWSA